MLFVVFNLLSAFFVFAVSLTVLSRDEQEEVQKEVSFADFCCQPNDTNFENLIGSKLVIG